MTDTRATDPLPEGVSASPDVTLEELQLAQRDHGCTWKASATT